MSGPKDYEVAFDTERLLRIMAARRRQLATRAAAAEARLLAAREKARRAAIKAQEEAEKLAAQRRQMAANVADNQELLAIARKRTEQHNDVRDKARASELEKVQERRVEEARKARGIATSESNLQNAGCPAGETAPVPSDSPMPFSQTHAGELLALTEAWDEFNKLNNESADSRTKQLSADVARVSVATKNEAAWKTDVIRLLDDLQNASNDLRRQNAELSELVGSLAGWQDELGTDEDIQAFQSQEASEALKKIDALMKQSDCDSGQRPSDYRTRIEALKTESQNIFDRAGELRAKFNTRNELLADVVDSLKKIGFFVSDPRYENDADPTGPVIIKATRAGEEMTASIDLTETVRSVWNGIADEKCKSSFFEYVDEMGKKGIDVKPLRSDLHSRPQLNQQGAKSLPRSSEKQSGS